MFVEMAASIAKGIPVSRLHTMRKTGCGTSFNEYDCAGQGGTNAPVADRKNSRPASGKSLIGIEPTAWAEGMKSHNASSLDRRDAKN